MTMAEAIIQYAGVKESELENVELLDQTLAGQEFQLRIRGVSVSTGWRFSRLSSRSNFSNQPTSPNTQQKSRHSQD